MSRCIKPSRQCPRRIRSRFSFLSPSANRILPRSSSRSNCSAGCYSFRLLRATCADSAGGGALQHPCVTSNACAGEHSSGFGGLCAVDTGLPSVPRKLQGHLQRDAYDLGRISKIGPEKRGAGHDIEDRIMLSPRQLEAAFHGEKQTQTNR
jgi:hypothetical protein